MIDLLKRTIGVRPSLSRFGCGPCLGPGTSHAHGLRDKLRPAHPLQPDRLRVSVRAPPTPCNSGGPLDLQGQHKPPGDPRRAHAPPTLSGPGPWPSYVLGGPKSSLATPRDRSVDDDQP